MEAFQDLLKSCVSFGWGLEGSNEEKLGVNRRKNFYSLVKCGKTP